MGLGTVNARVSKELAHMWNFDFNAILSKFGEVNPELVATDVAMTAW